MINGRVQPYRASKKLASYPGEMTGTAAGGKKMNRKEKTKRLVMLALLAAVLILMAFTPLGYLRIGPLSITFNTIPVAIGSIALGPVCGAILGAVFGLTSVMGGSALVMTLMSVNPVYRVFWRDCWRALSPKRFVGQG